jgi:hypothetical protein
MKHASRGGDGAMTSYLKRLPLIKRLNATNLIGVL